MKRGQSLARKTPLRARTELRAKTELSRGEALSPTSARRRYDNGLRTRVVNGLRVAQQGRCPRCRRNDSPLYGHERRGRAQGASIIAPEVALCCVCNDWCEDHPRVAAWTGWKVSAKWPHDGLLEPGQAVDLFGNVVVFADLAASFEDAS